MHCCFSPYKAPYETTCTSVMLHCMAIVVPILKPKVSVLVLPRPVGEIPHVPLAGGVDDFVCHHLDLGLQDSNRSTSTVVGVVWLVHT